MSLKAVHHILTAQMVASAHQGKLSRSLQYLCCPQPMSLDEVEKLPQLAQGMVLAGVPRHDQRGELQWMRMSDAKYASAPPSQYRFSAIAALPLPVWPFYLLGELDLGRHLECYIAAYYPEVEVHYLRPTLSLVYGPFLLSIDIPGDQERFCATLEGSGQLNASGYTASVGAVSICIRKNSDKLDEKNSVDDVSQFHVQDLSTLQYEGPAQATRITASAKEWLIDTHSYTDKEKSQEVDRVLREVAEMIKAMTARPTPETPSDLVPIVNETVGRLLAGEVR